MAYRFSNFTNIVALRRTKQSVISLTPSRQLEAYWTSLRDGGDVPMRTRIDPRGIANILPHAFMIERLSPSVASIRLAGQHLNQLVDGEARGLPFGLIYAPKARSSVATAINAVLDTPAIAQFDLRSTGEFGHMPMRARITLLPLRNPAKLVDRAIGVFVPEDAAQGRALKFELEDFDLRPVFGPAPMERPDPVEIAVMAQIGQSRPRLRIVK